MAERAVEATDEFQTQKHDWNIAVERKATPSSSSIVDGGLKTVDSFTWANVTIEAEIFRAD